MAGYKAGSLSVNGSSRTKYVQVRIDGKIHMGHRLAWQIYYGSEPDGMIDHIDGNGQNNKIENLRVVTNAESTRNMPMSIRNSSGLVGVRWSKQHSRWYAYISSDSKRLYLGSFKRKEDAINARKEAEEKYGYHKNHGRTTKTLNIEGDTNE